MSIDHQQCPLVEGVIRGKVLHSGISICGEIPRNAFCCLLSLKLFCKKKKKNTDSSLKVLPYRIDSSTGFTVLASVSCIINFISPQLHPGTGWILEPYRGDPTRALVTFIAHVCVIYYSFLLS